MTGRWARGACAVAALAVILPLAACASPMDDRTVAAPATAGPAREAAATIGPCPRLEHVAPRADGLPDLTLPCLGDGPAVRLSDLRGVPTVVNVWAAWCENCYREMPLFAEAAGRAGDRVRFVGIHYKATRAQGLQSEDDFGVPFPSVHDEDGDRVVAELGAYAPPQTFFVTADGRLAGREIGEITSERALTQLVKRYLEVDL